MSTDLKPSWWRRVRNSWQRRRQKPGTIDLLTDGFLVARGRRKTDVRWDDVIQIDGGVQDTLSLDVLFAVFHTSAAAITIDELDDGFRTFEGAVFERWPTIRDRWVELQCGPLHRPKFETLWQR
ncbi:MAG TPA: hypothetical protein VKR31_13460 [Rhizomicrobium sp.]|nr:hypothetical protein [Rhizomicrobium sp.]